MISDKLNNEFNQRFPSLRDILNDSETPYELWLRLRDVFFEAYKCNDRELIKKIYEFSDWCIQQPQEDIPNGDLATCVAVCFYEHIPENDTSRADMPNWFALNDVIAMREIFTENISIETFQEIIDAYDKRN